MSFSVVLVLVPSLYHCPFLPTSKLYPTLLRPQDLGFLGHQTTIRGTLYNGRMVSKIGKVRWPAQGHRMLPEPLLDSVLLGRPLNYIPAHSPDGSWLWQPGTAFSSYSTLHLSDLGEVPTGPVPCQPIFSAPSVILTSASSISSRLRPGFHCLPHTGPWFVHTCAGPHTVVGMWSLCHMSLPSRSSGVVSSMYPTTLPPQTLAQLAPSVSDTGLPPRRPPRLTDWWKTNSHCSQMGQFLSGNCASKLSYFTTKWDLSWECKVGTTFANQ